MSDIEVTQEAMSIIRTLTKLTTLEVAGNDLNNGIPWASSLTRLRSLDISSTQIPTHSFTVLERLSCLQLLQISPLEDHGFESLQKLHLTKLLILHTKILVIE